MIIVFSRRKRGISEITVIEIDSLRAQMAIRDGHTVVIGNDARAKNLALQKAQVLFSATGSKVLSRADIAHLRANDKSHQSVLFIASCTSPDDEFNPSFFTELEALSTNTVEQRLGCEKEYKLTPYELYDGRKIYLLNGGKAVNFAIGGTPGYEICQVWGAILFAVSKIATKELQPSSAVQTLTRDEEVAISKVTQSAFFSDSKDTPVKVVTELNRQRSRSFSSIPSGKADNEKLAVSEPKFF